MQISKDTVIGKMLAQLEEAQQTNSSEKVAEAMGHVKLLSELWLEEYHKNKHMSQQTFSAADQKNEQLNISSKQQQLLASAQKEINEEADDMSIFDF